MFKAGFYKKDLGAAIATNRPIAEERIDSVAAYFSDGTASALWMVLDFMDFNLAVVNAVKTSIASATGLDFSHIHVVTTHNHGGGFPNIPKLSSLAAECALGAVERATEARMKYAFGESDRKVNFRRRIYVPELSGVTSLFWGSTSQDGFDSAPFVENAVESIREGTLVYTGKRETSREFLPFEDADKNIFAALFCDKDGNTLGTLVRFAAHAVCANRPEHYSSDYPFHVRRTVEREAGGVCVFFNGPCGDITPEMTTKYDGCQKPLGEYIASFALSLLENSDFENEIAFKDESVPISLPVRAEVMDNFIAIPDKMPETLPERRKHLEALRFRDTLPFLREKYGEGESELCEEIDATFGILQLGNLYIAAFPGETFSETGEKFRKLFPEKDICTITEHGRSVMYIPPQKELALGGYETVCRLVTGEAEERLLRGAEAAYSSFLTAETEE